jgi:hypothetical protein
MSEVRVEVRLEGEGATPEFQAMGLLRARVRVHAPKPVYAKELECRLLWITEGKGTEDVGGTPPMTLARARELQPGETLSFEARLPGGPWSHDGQLLKIRWVVQAVLVGRWGVEADAESRFRLVPGVASASRGGVA